MIRLSLLLTLALLCAPAHAQTEGAPNAARQTEADGYSRYELLSPGSGKFRILYEVTATTPGARDYFNPIRKGSVATDERVTDRATGKPLAFDVVGAAVAQAGGVRNPDPEQQYIRVRLARPVPLDGGEARVLIDKTYEDAASYRIDGDQIIFDRPLGVKRNAVVLPLGYALVSANYPSQVIREADGRLKISFFNITPAQAPLVLRARTEAALRSPSPTAAEEERAHQNREITYELEDPASHAFRLFHDYTEERAGVGQYVNVVRAGSTVSDPSAQNLDTGAAVRAEILKGEAITRAGVAAPGLTVTPDAEVVVFRFSPPSSGGSVRLRIHETYTDPSRYRVEGDELVWERALGRPVNVVVLPRGWVLTGSRTPATVTSLPDGRLRLELLNPRVDQLEARITARRSASSAADTSAAPQ
jgi:hypothetical protein